jgi:RimJ/RimL family protein N-acetyltransferase
MAAKVDPAALQDGYHMPFDPQPSLQGELIELRPLREDDFDALYAVASDPLFWELHPDPDRYTLDVFTVFFREAMARGGALLAIDRRDGRVIGSSRFHGYDAGTSEDGGPAIRRRSP